MAVSVLVHPSRWMQILCGGLCSLCLTIALFVLWWQDGDVSRFVRIAAAGIAFAAATLVGLKLVKQRSVLLLDITGSADVRLSTIARTPKPPPVGDERFHAGAFFMVESVLVTPILLVLRLADKHANINTLLIFPDSVSKDGFRRLALACRWLMTQSKRRQHDIS